MFCFMQKHQIMAIFYRCLSDISLAGCKTNQQHLSGGRAISIAKRDVIDCSKGLKRHMG